MGCPCSKRSHPRQAGSGPDPSEQAALAASGEPQSGHPSRGYRWNGPERTPPPAPSEPTPAPAE